jgi:hypothetical protein
MDILPTLREQVRTLSLAEFLRARSGPFLLRYLTQEELAEPALEDLFSEETTTRGVQRVGDDASDLVSIFRTNRSPEGGALSRLTEPLDHFACYAVEKSDRNVFSYGSTLGRTKNNDVIIPLPAVSKFHAWLQRHADGSYFAFDARSHLGTFVNGTRVSPEGDQGTPLKPGATLGLGGVPLLFVESTSLYAWIAHKIKKL